LYCIILVFFCEFFVLIEYFKNISKFRKILFIIFLLHFYFFIIFIILFLRIRIYNKIKYNFYYLTNISYNIHNYMDEFYGGLNFFLYFYNINRYKFQYFIINVLTLYIINIITYIYLCILNENYILFSLKLYYYVIIDIIKGLLILLIEKLFLLYFYCKNIIRILFVFYVDFTEWYAFIIKLMYALKEDLTDKEVLIDLRKILVIYRLFIYYYFYIRLLYFFFFFSKWFFWKKPFYIIYDVSKNIYHLIKVLWKYLLYNRFELLYIYILLYLFFEFLLFKLRFKRSFFFRSYLLESEKII